MPVMAPAVMMPAPSIPAVMVPASPVPAVVMAVTMAMPVSPDLDDGVVRGGIDAMPSLARRRSHQGKQCGRQRENDQQSTPYSDRISVIGDAISRFDCSSEHR